MCIRDRPNAGDTPDEEAYKNYIKDQMTELLGGRYGEISALFWDIPPVHQDESVNEYVRKLMPGILINDRGYSAGDYSTPEREVPKNKSFSAVSYTHLDVYKRQDVPLGVFKRAVAIHHYLNVNACGLTNQPLRFQHKVPAVVGEQFNGVLCGFV